ncbi:hypothetical protein ABW21_db0206179 [Orbilia brochopaga]|nr:hypothetical protein ABW21_db0206179 [Drechslerella brochopaga]
MMAIAFLPNGKGIISVLSDDAMMLWDLSTKPSNRRESGPRFNDLKFVALSPDGKQIATGARPAVLDLWDTNGSRLESFRGLTRRRRQQHLTAVAFSPDGKLVASGDRVGTIVLWTSNGGFIKSFGSQYTGHIDETLQVPFPQYAQITALEFSPNGKLIASASDDGGIKLWSDAGALQEFLIGQSRSVHALAFSSNGRLLAAGFRTKKGRSLYDEGADTTIRLWDVTDYQEIESLGHDSVKSTAQQLGQSGESEAQTAHKILDSREWKEFSLEAEYPFSVPRRPRLKFSEDARFLSTSKGQLINVEGTYTKDQTSHAEALDCLWANGWWIYYGSMRLLRLPLEYKVAQHDTRGDQLAIGFENGKILSIHIDQKLLHPILRSSA